MKWNKEQFGQTYTDTFQQQQLQTNHLRIDYKALTKH